MDWHWISWSAAKAAAATRGTITTTRATTIIDLRIHHLLSRSPWGLVSLLLHGSLHTNNVTEEYATPRWINSRKTSPRYIKTSPITSLWTLPVGQVLYDTTSSPTRRGVE